MSNLPAVHSDGKIGLFPWQEQVVRDVYGTLNPDGTRQYQTVYIEIPKKNGKSTFMGMVILHALLIEQPRNAELYSCAYTRDQASHCYRPLTAMLDLLYPGEVESPIWNRKYYKEVHHTDSGSVYTPIAGEDRASHGYNPYLVAFDELHVQKKRDLYESMEAGVVRENAMFWSITTAGYDKLTICYEVHQYAERVLAGEIDDPTFYTVIFAADPDDDWTDPEVWRRANPSLLERGGIGEAKLRKDCERAKRVPARQNTFKRLHLNIWTSQQTRWLDTDEWAACGMDADKLMAAVQGLDCWGGLDLAVRFDLAAHVQLFRDDAAGVYYVVPHFWTSDDDLIERARKSGAPYDVWAREGSIRALDGNVIDLEEVGNEIISMAGQHRYKEIGIDLWQAEATSQQLSKHGLEVTGIPQNYRGMSGASKELEALILSRKIRHPCHPVLDWCISNVEVKRDQDGNIRPVRPANEALKIDGVVATVLALARAMLSVDQQSMYEDPNYRPTSELGDDEAVTE